MQVEDTKLFVLNFLNDSGFISMGSVPGGLNQNKYKILYVFFIDIQDRIFYAFP